MTVGNPRRGVERCQALIRSFHRGEFIGCSKVREKQQIKRRNIFSPASPDVRLGIVPRSKSSDDQQRNTFALAEEIRGLSLEKEIGLIARDKYESLGQLVHTWLARQVACRPAEWRLPLLSPRRVWLLSTEKIMRQISPSRSTI